MIGEDEVDADEVSAEVRAAFEDYERALLANDVAALDGWFWPDERAVRFGLGDREYGYTAIAAWRAGAEPVPGDRRVGPVVITTFGRDAAVVVCEFRSSATTAIGRQSQTWVRFAAGWRIVHAHVSVPAPPG